MSYTTSLRTTVLLLAGSQLGLTTICSRVAQNHKTKVSSNTKLERKNGSKRPKADFIREIRDPSSSP